MTKTPSPKRPAAAKSPPATTEPPALAKPGDPKGKLGMLVATLRTPGGVSLHDLAAVSDWQLHSVRGAMAGALKARGYAIHSKKAAEKGALRLYSLVEPQGDA